MPKFSIIIPCFNAAETLAETLQSIRDQTLLDWEAICIDDGSTDDTRMIVLSAGKDDERIKLAYNPGKGPSAARNFGAKFIARGSIISFCDADDIWSARKLTEVATFFDKTGCDATFGQIAFFEQKPSDARVFSTVPKQALTMNDLLAENPICTMSNVSIRKTALLRFGWFDETVVYNEDLEWLVRIVGQGAKVLGQKSQQVWYRKSPNGLSSNLAAMKAGRKAAIKTALQFGARPSRQSNAIYQRYLARRALRMGHGRMLALKLALLGVAQSPRGFMSPPRRGALTLLGALANFSCHAPSRAPFSLNSQEPLIMKLATIVVPAFNVASTLTETLTSLLAQTYENFEIVVVDDGSSDETLQIAQSFAADPKLRIVRQPNRGLAGARNTGISSAKGAYIGFCDADDIWEPHKLAAHVRHLDADPFVGVSYAGSQLMHDDGRPMKKAQQPRLTGVDAAHIFKRNPIGNGSAPVIRAQVFEDIAYRPKHETKRDWYFDETFRQSEDIECWVRIAITTAWKFEGIEGLLTRYRINQGGLSASTDKQLAAWDRMVAN